MELNINTIEALKEAIERSSKIVITSHFNPDGDAMGAALGLHHALAAIGTSSTVITPNGFPDFLAWMPGASSIIRYAKQQQQAGEALQNADLIFCLDFNSFGRTELMQHELEKSTAQKVLIDHHPDPESIFDIAISHTEVSSTAELIYEVICAMYGAELINSTIAKCLLTGIITDTGSFSYACNRQRTFAIAGKLVAQGVNIDQIQSLIYNNFTESRLKMLGHCLSQNMRVFTVYKSAYISLSLNEQKAFNYQIGDTEGIVNYPLSIRDIAFSVLFVEGLNHVKVSLRSRGQFPVNKLAQEYYNGGGHTNAAGGKSFKPLAETIAQFEELITKIQDERLLQYRNECSV